MIGGRGFTVAAIALQLLAVVAGQGAVHADDLGPLLSDCVGAECPLLAAYPNPNVFPAPPSGAHRLAAIGALLGIGTLALARRRAPRRRSAA